MKKIYRYIALAAVTIGFAACTQEEDFAPQQSDIVQIASAYIATEVQTRVNTEGAGDAFENTDEILLINTTRTNKNEGTYTYNNSNSTWSLTAGMVLWASGSNQFTAYYPASETFELPTDQSTLDGLKSADRMTATATVSKGYPVSLGFEHQNAKVTITTVVNSQYDASATISDLKIGGISPYPVDNAYTAILEPTENGFTVTLKVNSTDELTATTPRNTTLEAGKHYTFTLKVGKSVATLGEVSVVEWETTNPLTGGEAIELDCLDETTNTFYVATANGLYAWNEAAQADLSINLVLMADITLPNTDLTTGAEITVANGVPSGSNWTPISTDWEKGYIGTFDGNNHTISGLRITTETDYAGFIGCLGNGTGTGEIKNLTLADAVLYSTATHIGGFVGYNSSGTISGCTFGSTTDNSSVSGAGDTAEMVGGIVAYTCGGSVSSCTNNGTVSASATFSWAGGIAAYSYEGLVSDCTNNDTVSSTGTDLYAGGIVGYNGNNSTVSGCTNNGTVSSTGKDSSSGSLCAGGIVGGNIDSTVSGCINKGEASGTGSSENNVGGIVGKNLRGTVSDDNINNGIPADE